MELEYIYLIRRFGVSLFLQLKWVTVTFNPLIKHVRDLGAWFDYRMSMNTHKGKVCSKAFGGLYNIRKIRKYLSAESTECLIHAFVTSH